MSALNGRYSHRDLRLIYTAKGEAMERAAELAAPGCFTDRIPNWLRSLAAEWYALAAKEADLESSETRR